MFVYILSFVTIKSVIRKALLTDVDRVWELKQNIILDVSRVNDLRYSSKIQSEGFIVSENSKEEVRDRINSSTIFYVFEEEGQIKGFIDINKEIYFPEEVDNIFWLDKNLKTEYFHGAKSTALHLIITNDKARKKGVASELLQNAIGRLKSMNIKHIFSIITTGPVTNCPSIIWHTKMGFERVCLTSPIKLFGLDGYTSLLLCKNI